MKNSNYIFTSVIAFLMLFLISCQPKPEPSAVVGWDGNQKVVQVTDDNGEQFLMNYLIYQQLFSNGGYNNVVHHYHSYPQQRYRPSGNASFHAAKVQPRSMSNFSGSYRKVAARRATIERAKARYSTPKTSSSKSSSFFKKSSSSPSRSSWSRSSSSRSSSSRRR